MTKKIKPQRTQKEQRRIRGYGKGVSVTSVLSVVFEPIPENIKKSRACGERGGLKLSRNSACSAVINHLIFRQCPKRFIRIFTANCRNHLNLPIRYTTQSMKSISAISYNTGTSTERGSVPAASSSEGVAATSSDPVTSIVGIPSDDT